MSAGPVAQLAQRRRIGRTPLEVTALGLGCAGLGGLYRDVSEADARATIDAAWEAGVRLFDTAPYYGYTKSEHYVGAALRERERASYVLSTKAGRLMRPERGPSARAPRDGWAHPLPFLPVYDYSYDGIMRSFEDSLQRLGVAEIDILLVHDIGALTHGERHAHYWRQLSEGGFKALDALRGSGAVRAVGLGVNEQSAIIDAMREFEIDCALLAGRYTLLEQAALDALLPECERRGVSILAGGAFNSGILARGVRHLRESPDRGSSALKFDYGQAPAAVVERVGQIEAICDAHGVALPSAALRFPYAHRAVASVLTGASSASEFEANAAAFAATIPAGLWDALRDAGLLDTRAPTPSA
ncbi:pyridoxal 4-dehydrogenase [Trinickia dabaoshanensis]|uniref:Pyridoxal 4-dehydrogenase n=1 Tax=Trinickia dabaoshanensis TaxID=564714 RepID=A0A2N7VC12_9BURK|nr:aldo/keto reductase [Trinickia dabaoshanensis]PMS14708.1 pyridoxal 4-dehydrogenase [Trinickia dabaoshanensis]